LDLDVISKERGNQSAVIAVTTTAGQRFPPAGHRSGEAGSLASGMGTTWTQATVFIRSGRGVNRATCRTRTSYHHLLVAPATEETGYQHRR
jgi:hypothetical protein